MRSPFDCLELQSPFFKAASAAAPPDITAPTINTFTVGTQTASGLPITLDVSADDTLPYLVYIVGIPTGNTAPDADQVINGDDSTDTTAPIVITYDFTVAGTETETITTSDLDANYDFYCVVTDSASPANASTVASDTNIAIDTTAPSLSALSGTQTGQTTATWGVTSDKAGGTIYAAAYPTASSAPTAAQLIAGTGGSIVAADSDSTPTADANNAGSFTGLTAATAYRVAAVHVDALGNQSTVATSAEFTTASAVTNILADQNREWTDSGVWLTSGAGITHNDTTGVVSLDASSSAFTTKIVVREPGFSPNLITGIVATTTYEVWLDVTSFTTGGDIRINIKWYTAAEAYVGITNGSNKTISGVTSITQQHTAPATAEKASITVVCISSGVVFDMENISMVVV